MSEMNGGRLLALAAALLLGRPGGEGSATAKPIQINDDAGKARSAETMAPLIEEEPVEKMSTMAESSAQDICPWYGEIVSEYVPAKLSPEQEAQERALEALEIKPEDIVSLGEPATADEAEVVIVLMGYESMEEVNFRAKFVGGGVEEFFRKIGVKVHFSYVARKDIEFSYAPYADRKVTFSVEQARIVLEKIRGVEPRTMVVYFMTNTNNFFGGAAVDEDVALGSGNSTSAGLILAHEIFHKLGGEILIPDLYVTPDGKVPAEFKSTAFFTDTKVVDPEVVTLAGDLGLTPQPRDDLVCGPDRVFTWRTPLPGEKNIMEVLPEDDIAWRLAKDNWEKQVDPLQREVVNAKIARFLGGVR